MRDRPGCASLTRATPLKLKPVLEGSGLRLIAAMIVISGMIERSWNSSTANARSPKGVRRRPADCSIGSTWAVEDKPSGKSKGYCLVKFATKEAANMCRHQMHG